MLGMTHTRKGCLYFYSAGGKEKGALGRRSKRRLSSTLMAGGGGEKGRNSDGRFPTRRAGKRNGGTSPLTHISEKKKREFKAGNQVPLSLLRRGKLSLPGPAGLEKIPPSSFQKKGRTRRPQEVPTQDKKEDETKKEKWERFL